MQDLTPHDLRRKKSAFKIQEKHFRSEAVAQRLRDSGVT
jgi:hypothetical protein